MVSDEQGCGEVELELNAYRHPATGEFDGMVRGTALLLFFHHNILCVLVISASNLRGLSGLLNI